MLVGLAPKVELEIQEARELRFPRNGGDASPGEATWCKSPSPPVQRGLRVPMGGGEGPTFRSRSAWFCTSSLYFSFSLL